MWPGMEPPELRDAVGAPHTSPRRSRAPESAIFIAAMAELPAGGPVVSAMSSPSWPMQPAGSGKSLRCNSASSVGSGGISYTTGGEAPPNPGSPPMLLCGCKCPVVNRTSHTPRNANREFFMCEGKGTKKPFSCHRWIWVDLLMAYVNQLVEYRTRSLRARLDDALTDAREKQVKMDEEQVKMDEQRIQINVMHTQNNEMRAKIENFKKLRYALLIAVMICFVLPAGSVAGFLLVASIALMMFFA